MNPKQPKPSLSMPEYSKEFGDLGLGLSERHGRSLEHPLTVRLDVLVPERPQIRICGFDVMLLRAASMSLA